MNESHISPIAGRAGRALFAVIPTIRAAFRVAACVAVAHFQASAAAPGNAGTPGKLPLKGGENVLFIGNSLTAELSEWLNEAAKANGLPTFNGHRLQIWNQTFRTHVLINEEDYGTGFNKELTDSSVFYEKAKLDAVPGSNGYRLRGACTLWKKGQYDIAEFNERGYITALEAIKRGTPEGEPWDVVVLQGYTGADQNGAAISRDADGKIQAEGHFMVYGSLLIEAAKAEGAQPVLYAATGINPAMGGGANGRYTSVVYSNGIGNYQALGNAHGIPVIPVRSAAWALSGEHKPEGAPAGWLFIDTVHASASGYALLHYMMLGALYGRSPMELNYSLDADAFTDWRREGNRNRHYVVGKTEAKHDLLITPEIDCAIREVATQHLREYGWLP